MKKRLTNTNEISIMKDKDKPVINENVCRPNELHVDILKGGALTIFENLVKLDNKKVVIDKRKHAHHARCILCCYGCSCYKESL